MRTIDLILKKKQGLELTKEEINFFINSVMDKSMPDYQISAFLMAVCFQGMSDLETSYLTEAIVKSGSFVEQSKLPKGVLDKHSTGGVGDKITLTLTPLLAASGIPCLKLSGRALGHTGGTIDKLESIPGFNTDCKIDDMIEQVKKINLAIGAQTKGLTPADGILYALRDVTGTVDNVSLIASSVISKKIASGAENIVLDVKCGKGAFMKDPQDAVHLAKLMVQIGKHLGRKVIAVITSMDEPLGRAVGNSLEVIEACEFLKGHYKEGEVYELTYELAILTLLQYGICTDRDAARRNIDELITSGKAIEKFKELVKAQGGLAEALDNYSKLPTAGQKVEIKSEKDGFVENIDAYKVALGCKLLGAGRETKADKIDLSVGVYLNKKSGERVNKGEVLYTIYSNDADKTAQCKELCDKAYEIADTEPPEKKLIYEIVQ